MITLATNFKSMKATFTSGLNFYLRGFSTIPHLRKVITIRSAQTATDELAAKLLTKHRDENILRIAKLKKILEFDKFGLQISDESELMKCFYPTKHATLKLPDGTSSSNRHLEILGKQLLYLQVLQAYLKLFKRSECDVCGYDFNYPSKMENMSDAKKKPATVILRHLKQISLVDLARIPVPKNQISLRKQSHYDLKSFYAILGYVFLTNNEENFSSFLKKIFAEKLINTVLLR
ncbi:CBS1 (YDL069C) [Zygosaccharomyces parabailii]|nr:CBS1 (YDL069C) [Zygosaccharomyces parabailii]